MSIFLLTLHQFRLVAFCFVFLSIQHPNSANTVEYLDDIGVKTSFCLLLIFLYFLQIAATQNP